MSKFTTSDDQCLHAICLQCPIYREKKQQNNKTDLTDMIQCSNTHSYIYETEQIHDCPSVCVAIEKETFQKYSTVVEKDFCNESMKPGTFNC